MSKRARSKRFTLRDAEAVSFVASAMVEARGEAALNDVADDSAMALAVRAELGKVCRFCGKGADARIHKNVQLPGWHAFVMKDPKRRPIWLDRLKEGTRVAEISKRDVVLFVVRIGEDVIGMAYGPGGTEAVRATFDDFYADFEILSPDPEGLKAVLSSYLNGMVDQKTADDIRQIVKRYV